MSTREDVIENARLTKLLYAIAVVFSITGLIILIVFLFGLGETYTIFGDSPLDLDSSAKVGDFIGGLVGSVWSFAGVILFFLALMLQRKEFRLQRNELKNQRNEFKINRITNVIYKQLELTIVRAKKAVMG